MSIRSLCVGLSVAVFAVLAANPAAAQTSGSWNVNANGNYSATTNWVGGVVPNAGGIATFGSAFGQTGFITVTLDISPTLSGLTFDSPYEYNLTGGTITTTGTFTIDSTENSASTSPQLFSAGTTITSAIAGSGGLTKIGPGTVTLSSATNSFTGGVFVNDGVLRVTSGSDATFGNAANAINIDGGILTTSGVALVTARPINIGPNGATFRQFIQTTLSGPITGNGALIKSISNAPLVLNGDASAFTGPIVAESGVTTLQGPAVIGGTTDIDVAGTLTLNNGGQNVNARTARGVLSRGGVVTLTGNSSGTAATLGNYTLEQGWSLVTITPSVLADASLSFTGLTRNNNATVLFRGTNLGATPDANVGQVIFTSSPGTLVGGGGDPNLSTTASILPFATGNTAAGATLGSTFVTWDSGSGRIIPLNIATGYTTNITTAGATDNVSLTAGAALAAPTTINSLRLNLGASGTLSGSPLTINSGAILQTAAAGATLTTISAQVAAPAGQELVVTSNSGNVGATPGGLLISGAISGTAGLTLAGNGAITLTGANTYTGPTTIATGSLLLPAGTVTADGTPSVLGQDTSPIVLGGSGSINTRLLVTGPVVVDRGFDVTTGPAATALGTLRLGGESLVINGDVSITNPTGSHTNRFLFFEGGAIRDEAVTVNGNISGSGAVRGNFGAYTILNGTNNTFTGGVLMGLTNNAGTSAATLRSETWEVGADNALGTGPVYIQTSAVAALAAGPNDYPTTVIPTLLAGGGPRSIGNPVILQNQLLVVGGTNDLTLTGPVRLNGNAVVSVNDAGTTATFAGTVNQGSLYKSGLGTLVLSNPANTYAGQTFIQGVVSADTLANGGTPSSLGQAPATAGYLLLGGGTLRYTGAGASTDKLFTLSGAGGTLDASGSGPIAFTNTGTQGSSSLTGVTGATINALSSVITFGNLVIGPQLILGGVMTNANFPAGTTITEIGPNFIRLSNVSTNTAAATAQTLTFVLPATRTLTLTGTNTGANTLATTLVNPGTGNLAVAKTGPGTWVLTGNSTYTGGTTISDGVLVVNNATGSGTGTADVTVGGTGTLRGTGTATGPVALNAGGTLQGGDGGAAAADVLALSGGVTLSGSNTIRTVVADTNVGNGAADPTASLIDLGPGTLTGTGGLTTIRLSGSVNNLDLFQEYTVTIATFAATSNLTVTDFAIDPNPEGFAFQGSASLDLLGTSLVITFTPAPEPGTVLGVTALVGLGIVGARRRLARRAA